MENLTNFQKVVLYIVEHSPGVGAVQLNKGLFYADAMHYAHFGKPYTECEYVKEKRGPVPNNVCFNQINSLLVCGLIDKKFQDVANTDYVKKAYYINDKYSDDEINKYFDFEKNVLDILKSTVRFISNKTAKQLSDYTHNEVYHRVVMRDVIPFSKVVEFVVDEDELEPSNIFDLLRDTYAN